MAEASVPQSAIVEAALRLRRAAETGEPCTPVRDLLSAGGIGAAYAAQATNTAHWLAAGRRITGRKIGLTSPVVQRQLGVNQPDYGMLWADIAVGENEPIPPGSVMQPKVEAEVALVLDRELAAERPTLADVVRATAYVVPAIEVVGSRVAGWDINILDTIADNASSGLYVLGGPLRRLEGLDLRDCAMRLEIGGAEASRGIGSACLGHPLNAAVWLARRMAELGTPLQAGDVVLTGALGPMSAVGPGDRVEAQIDGLGSVSAVFGT